METKDFLIQNIRSDDESFSIFTLNGNHLLIYRPIFFNPLIPEMVLVTTEDYSRVFVGAFDQENLSLLIFQEIHKDRVREDSILISLNLGRFITKAKQAICDDEIFAVVDAVVDLLPMLSQNYKTYPPVKCEPNENSKDLWTALKIIGRNITLGGPAFDTPPLTDLNDIVTSHIGVFAIGQLYLNKDLAKETSNVVN